MQTFDLHLSDYDASTRRVRVAVNRSPAGVVDPLPTGVPPIDLATDLNEGFLVLEDDRGEPDLLPAGLLATFLRSRNVRLAVLNACETAQTGQDIWAGMALVLAGVPAVIAMQTAVLDQRQLSDAQAGSWLWTREESGRVRPSF
jgi:hypothetical protein